MPQTYVQSSDDVVEFLKGQHNLIKDLFDEVIGAASREARESAFVGLRQLLAVHETAEEMVVHPRARREIENGDAVVDARIDEEHQAKEKLSKLESMDIDSEQFLKSLNEFREDIVTHAEREESEEFTKLQRNLDPDTLKHMAAAVKAAEAIAPTRPHAGVESATANFAVGPFASMLDRARDLMARATR